MFFHKTPVALKWLYPQLIWTVPVKTKTIYLTFDDGPVPDLTEFILETLAQFEAKATFFCVGDNLVKYPHIAKKAIARGHVLGNHTFNHLNGWKTDPKEYIANIEKCDAQLTQLGQDRKLLRPPYGRISRKQIKLLRNTHKIVMWDVLSGDFSSKITRDRCLHESIRATQKGSVVLFHDNVKAEDNMKFTLTRYLEHFRDKGYQFSSL